MLEWSLSILQRKISNVNLELRWRLERAEASPRGLLVLSKLHKSRRTKEVWPCASSSPRPPTLGSGCNNICLSISNQFNLIEPKRLDLPLRKSARIGERGFGGQAKVDTTDSVSDRDVVVGSLPHSARCHRKWLWEDAAKMFESERQGRRRPGASGSHRKWLPNFFNEIRWPHEELLLATFLIGQTARVLIMHLLWWVFFSPPPSSSLFLREVI